MLFNILFALLMNLTKPPDFKINQVFSIEKPIERNIGIKLNAKSAIVINGGTGEVLFEKNSGEVMPIASISKLISALVFLDHNPGWDKEIKIIKSDDRIGGKLYVSDGEVVTVKDLFYSSLVGSANNATIALARSTGMEMKEFVEKMNEKAKALGMENSSFKEPTGLSEKNTSTASDIVKLALAAYNDNNIRSALQSDDYVFYTVDKKRIHTIKNTDKLLNSFLDEGDYKVIGAKTGYTEEAMYCLALGVEDKNGSRVISVILGSETENERFQEAKSMAWWGIRKISNLEF